MFSMKQEILTRGQDPLPEIASERPPRIEAPLQEPAACSADFQICCIADFQSADRPYSQGFGSLVPEHARPRKEASHVRAEQGAWASPNSVVEDSRSIESQSQRAREITPILRQILQRSPAPSHWGLNE